jgi:peroxidase
VQYNKYAFKMTENGTYLFQSKGPTWPVVLGRRDGRMSIANETEQLPPPTANLTQLIQMFAVKGLDLKDLVVLSGNK